LGVFDSVGGERHNERPSGMTLEILKLKETLKIQKVPEVMNEQLVEGLKPRATKKKLLNYF
jgi:hypothetical protein